MQTRRKTHPFAVAALVALAAAAAYFGAPLLAAVLADFVSLPPELGSLAATAPLLALGSVDADELKRLLVAQGEAFGVFKREQEGDISKLSKALADLQLAQQRPNTSDGAAGPASDSAAGETWVDTKSQRRVHVLGPADRLAALDRSSDPAPSVGRFLRGLVVGGRADDAKELAEERKALAITPDPAGGYTVSGRLAAEWVDLLRANMVLSRVGARTVPMDSKSLTIAKLTGDPVVAWHAENGDIAASDPTFGAVELNARTAVALVRLSLELAQDSANIESVLTSALVNAMAGAIDSAGLVGVTTDAAAAPAGVMSYPNRNRVTSIGAPTSWDFVVDGMYELMADNVPLERIGAMIGHPALWRKLRKLKTGLASDNTPLAAPAEVAALPKLWTTAAPLTGGTTADAVIANWSDLVFGIRQDITVRVLQESFLGSNLQVAILAYARVDFVPAREASFCTLEGITV